MNVETLSIYSRYTGYTLFIKYMVTLLLTSKLTKVPFMKLIKFMLKINTKFIANTLNGIYFSGETLSEASNVTKMLAKNGIFSILDYAVEGEENEQFFDSAVDFTLDLIDFASQDNNIPYIVIKPSSLGSTLLYESKIKNDSFFKANVELWKRIINRYERIFSYAHEMSVRVMIDAEQSWIQQSVDEIVLKNIIKYNREIPLITITLQCYRRDSYEFIKLMYETAMKNDINIGIKLVRGAYLEEEMKRDNRFNDTFFINKSETDENYNFIVDFVISKIENFTPFFATHNEISIKRILENDLLSGKNFWLGQLYGVGDHISISSVINGAKVCKYLPFGPFEKSVPYLLRRIEENAVSIETFRNENVMIRKELLLRFMNRNYG